MSDLQGGLVFTRLVGESFTIGDDIVVQVYEIIGNRAKIRVVAPKHIPVVRSELLKKQRREGTRHAS